MEPALRTTHVGTPRAHEHRATPSELGDICLASGRHAGFWGPGGKKYTALPGLPERGLSHFHGKSRIFF